MDIQAIDEIINEATARYKKGKYFEAADLYSQAGFAYKDISAPLLAAEMKNNQSVALLLGKNPQAALAACINTSEIFLAQKDEKRAGVAFANEAAAYEALGKLKEAEEKYKLAADNLKSAGEKDMYAQIFQSLSQLQIKMGKQFEALSSMKINLDSTENKNFKQKLLIFILKIQKILLP